MALKRQWRKTAVLVACALLLAVVLFLRPREHGPPPAEVSIPLVSSTAGVDPLVVQAIDEAVAVLRHDPTNGALFGELGKVYHAHEYHALARRSYEIAADLDASGADWPYFLGLYAEGRGETDEAITRFERAIALTPLYAPAHLHLGETLLVAGDLDGAENAFGRYLELRAAQPWGSVGLGKVARRRELFDDAAVHLERALELGGGDSQVSYLLAMTYRRLGRNEDAARLLGALAATSTPPRPPDPRLQQLRRRSAGLQGLVYRANRFLGEGSLEQAEQLYLQILELDPEHYTALVNLGNVYGRQGRGEEALAPLRRAAALDPDNPHAHYGLALALVSGGRLAAARVELQSVLRLDPSHPNAGALLERLERR